MALMDPAAHLPERLQKRLDSWMQNPPKWQHQAYGPLNAYFSLKFPPSHFLVKPQALLRRETPTDNSDDGDPGDQSFDSIDSHGWSCSCKVASHLPNVKGAAVTKARLYPDFDIDQYWGADDDTNKWPDIVRMVVEIASFNQDSGNSHSEAVFQLQSYLETVGERWDQRLVGLAIHGNEAYLMHVTDDDLRIREVYENPNGLNQQNEYWMSLFDPRVVQVLNEIYNLSMDNDDDDDDDDDDEGEDEDEDEDDS